MAAAPRARKPGAARFPATPVSRRARARADAGSCEQYTFFIL